MQFNTMNILVTDENEAQRILLKQNLNSLGFSNIIVLPNTNLVAHYLKTLEPDLVLLKLEAGKSGGFDTLNHIQNQTNPPPVLALVDAVDDALVETTLLNGAKDVLCFPFKSAELEARINSLLEARQLQKTLRKEKHQSKLKTERQLRQLEQTQVEMLIRLAQAAEYRDDETGEHVWRVAHTSWLLALELNMSASDANLILRAARLHDVGKIGIPDRILRKPGRLTENEFNIIKSHTTIGAELLSGGQSVLIQMAEIIALTHHERWDGAGYPAGLAKEHIPIEGRILAVADTFDALTHDRIHQQALSISEAVDIISSQRGKQFDPKVVDAFLRLYEKQVIPYEPSKSSAMLPALV